MKEGKIIKSHVIHFLLQVDPKIALPRQLNSVIQPKVSLHLPESTYLYIASLKVNEFLLKFLNYNTDGHSNQKDVCWWIICFHYIRRHQSILSTVWKGLNFSG